MLRTDVAFTDMTKGLLRIDVARLVEVPGYSMLDSNDDERCCKHH